MLFRCGAVAVVVAAVTRAVHCKQLRRSMVKKVDLSINFGEGVMKPQAFGGVAVRGNTAREMCIDAQRQIFSSSNPVFHGQVVGKEFRDAAAKYMIDFYNLEGQRLACHFTPNAMESNDFTLIFSDSHLSDPIHIVLQGSKVAPYRQQDGGIDATRMCVDVKAHNNDKLKPNMVVQYGIFDNGSLVTCHLDHPNRAANGEFRADHTFVVSA